VTYLEHSDDLLILVDGEDNAVGEMSKAECHLGNGTLHRAFSVFLFNENGDLLLQQRSKNKPLWPLIWANSCCSHPRAGEATLSAAHRRVNEELGIKTNLEYLFKFEYQAQYNEQGAEHELCWVFVGHFTGDPKVDPSEISDWRFIKPEDLAASIEANPDEYSPWLKLEWARISHDFLGKIRKQS
jgi:isopentenyl-diphosphate Delta-isomerase